MFYLYLLKPFFYTQPPDFSGSKVPGQLSYKQLHRHVVLLFHLQIKLMQKMIKIYK